MRSDDIYQFIPVAAAFGFAAFRLLPSVNRLLGSFNSLQFGEPIIDTLSQEVDHFHSNTNKYKEEQRPGKGFVFEHSLELIDVSYKYPGSTDNSINNISLKVMKGESVGFIGKSGAGKSTLTEIILGLLVPDSGKIYIDGKDIQNQLDAWHNQIGYVQQDIFLLDDSILNNIVFGNDDSEVNIKKITEAIKYAQLSEFVASLPDGLNTKLGERGVRLSGGQKQRIGIARALYRNCSILIFDEATSSLDNETEAEIVLTIKNLKKEKTIIIIAHRLSTIEYCDRVIELNNGYLHR
jgi:ABC-type multidrug transport system fused ATPase/permease subunit